MMDIVGVTEPNHDEREPTESNLFVKSFAKGLRILEAFGMDAREMSLSQLAVATGLDKSAVQRFTHTLHALHYLRKNEATKHYSLGPKVLELGSMFLRLDDLAERGMPMLRECNAACGETVNLARLDRHDIVYVARLPSRHAVGVDIMVGSRLQAYCSAVGRAILSTLPEPQAKELIRTSRRKQITEHTITGLDENLQILAGVRVDGYAITQEEIHLGDISVAAPIIGPNGRAEAAVGIAVPTNRWTRDGVRERLAPVVLALSRVLSRPSSPAEDLQAIRSASQVSPA